MKTWLQRIPFLSYDQQQVITDGNPYLCENGIHRGAIEGFYMKMLLYQYVKFMRSFAKFLQRGQRPVGTGKMSVARLCCSDCRNNHNGAAI